MTRWKYDSVLVTAAHQVDQRKARPRMDYGIKLSDDIQEWRDDLTQPHGFASDPKVPPNQRVLSEKVPNQLAKQSARDSYVTVEPTPKCGKRPAVAVAFVVLVES